MKVSLEQWAALVAVVETGGYAQAAEALNKSQSTVTYSVQKLESALDMRVFAIKGRRAQLTPAGEVLYRRAKMLLDEAGQIEQMACRFTDGWVPTIRIAMDTLFPEAVMLSVLKQFAHEHPQTQLELRETVLSGSDEALLKKEVDLVITGRVPPGFAGIPLMTVTFRAVAAPDHPLHQLNRRLTYQDLRQYCQLVVKDSGSRGQDAGWLGAQQRLTLSHISTSIRSAVMGVGFTWLPLTKIAQELSTGQLKPLPLEEGEERHAQLFLVYRDGTYTPAPVKALGTLIQQQLIESGFIPR